MPHCLTIRHEYHERAICIRSIYKTAKKLSGDEIIREGVWYDCKIIHYSDSPNRFMVRISSEGIPEFGINGETYENNFITVDEYRESNIKKLLN